MLNIKNKTIFNIYIKYIFCIRVFILLNLSICFSVQVEPDYIAMCYILWFTVFSFLLKCFWELQVHYNIKHSLYGHICEQTSYHHSKYILKKVRKIQFKCKINPKIHYLRVSIEFFFLNKKKNPLQLVQEFTLHFKEGFVFQTLTVSDTCNQNLTFRTFFQRISSNNIPMREYTLWESFTTGSST